jgi:hypothetical protein
MLDDALRILAGAGAVLQRGRVLVGNQRQLVQTAAGQLAHALR